MLKRIFQKAMDQIGNLIKNLEGSGIDPVLIKLNMEGLSKVQPQTNGTPAEKVMDVMPAIDKFIASGASQPKTNGELNKGTSGPSPADIAALTQMIQSTTPVQPTQPTIKTAPVDKAPTLPAGITSQLVAQYQDRFKDPDSGKVPPANVAAAILKAAKDTGTDPNLLFQFANAESKYDPSARPILRKKDPKTGKYVPVIDPKTGKPKYASSATGLFQILDSTWNYIMNDLGGKEKFGLKGNKLDPYENAIGGALYLNETKKALSKARDNGGNYTYGEYYLGHFAGPQTAAKALKMVDNGKGSLPASAVFTSEQIEKNPTIFYKDGKLRSIKNVIDRLDGKVAMKQDTNIGEA